MTYDKSSFLAGLAVGRQLKGWATADALGDIRKYAGWSADPAYTRVQRGRLAQYDLYGDGFTLETSGLSYHTNELVSVSGNTVTMLPGDWRYTGHDFWIDSNEFALGDTVFADMSVLALNARLGVGLSNYGTWPAVWSQTGVFTTGGGTHPGATETGRGTVEFVKDYTSQTLRFGPTAGDGSSASWVYATVEINALRVDYACYKQRTGYCVAAFVKYLDGSDSVRLTPCLISGVRHFTLYGSADDGTSQTGTVTSHTLDGMTFYMCSDYAPALAGTRKLVGAALLDFTAGDPITSKDALFAAVADATGLAVYPGTA